MPSVILARLDLHRKAFPAGLKDEVQLSIFLFVEVPQLESDKCPACGETVLAKPECDRLDALMEAFERSVNTELLPIGIGGGWLKEDVVYLLPSKQKENVF